MMAQQSGVVFQKPAEPYDPRGRLDPAGFERNIGFSTSQPPPDLSGLVEHFWSIRWDIARGVYESAEVMHRPYVDLFAADDQSGIQGTFRGKRIYRAEGNGRVVGVRFRPGAFRLFWPGRMSELQDRNASLTEAFALADAKWVAELLQQDDAGAFSRLAELLHAVAPAADPNVDLINRAISMVENNDDLQSVRAVAEALDRSERWIQQLFNDYVGIGLKWLLQRRRLLAAASQIRAVGRPDWVGIAYDLGYSSQQHFITDFRAVLGCTPVQYKKGLTVP